MNEKDVSVVHIQTKDGLEVLAYSEWRHLVSPFLDKMTDHGNLIRYLLMPDVTSASIRHILNIFSKQVSITFNVEEVEDIRDTARMLGVSSKLSDIGVKKYHCSEEGNGKDAFIIS